ncbi:hypothetical protein MKX03_034637, partial [Papaver bracteatum]
MMKMETLKCVRKCWSISMLVMLGVHRSLGTHISKNSGLITLNDWSDEEIDSMIEIGGNSSANSTYDTFIPVGITKLGADSRHERRSKFI